MEERHREISEIAAGRQQEAADAVAAQEAERVQQLLRVKAALRIQAAWRGVKVCRQPPALLYAPSSIHRRRERLPAKLCLTASPWLVIQSLLRAIGGGGNDPMRRNSKLARVACDD